MLEGGEIQASLFDPSTVEAGMTNSRFVGEYCVGLLGTAFPHLQPFVTLSSPLSEAQLIFENSAQIKAFITSLQQQNQDPIRFKISLRDFLIQLREFQGEEVEVELFDDEAVRIKKEEDARRVGIVPGMLKPSEIMGEEEL